MAAYIVARPSDKLRKLEAEKFETSLELAAIKSIQVDLVRHSKLKRKAINLEKEIDKLQAETAPRHKKVKQLFRTVRVSYMNSLELLVELNYIVLVGLCIYCIDRVFVGHAVGCV
jgi:hypothetical protein